MEQIAQSNIFFMVTTVSVIVLTSLFVVVLIQVIRILKKIDTISTKIQQEGENIVADVTALRSNLKEKGKGALSFIGMLVATAMGAAATKKNTKKKNK
jgi:hypothetical protein